MYPVTPYTVPKEAMLHPFPSLATAHLTYPVPLPSRMVKPPSTRMPTHPPSSATYITVQQGTVSSHVPFYTAQSHTYAARHVQRLSSRKLPGYAIHSFSPSFFKSTLKQFTRPLHNLPISKVLISEDRLQNSRVRAALNRLTLEEAERSTETQSVQIPTTHVSV